MGNGLSVTSEKSRVYKTIKTNKEGQNYALYSTTIASKTNTGSYKNAYMTLRFKGNPDIPNKSTIAIEKAFISFNPNIQNGEKYPFIQVMEYKMLEVGSDDMSNSAFTNISGSMVDEMPFV